MTETPTGSGGNGPGNQPHEFGRLGDRYEIGGLLGRGGMADVRVGRDLRLGRTVAIKRLRTDLASDPTFLARFRREAQSAAALNHPSIVAVYDTGEAPGPDGQTVPYIVMEYVEGQTLREIMRDGRKILPQRSLEITADILGALDYSHRAGIVHRDIKPGNVMLTPDGQVKVMDFGIARAIADSSSAMTQTAAVVGTAQYLSPEQARGEQVDARSDIYSTGCLLFELLSGRPPFVGDSPVSVAYQHVREEPAAPSSHNPEVTPSVDAIVARALAKRTEDRYQSAAEMRSDIERVLAGQDVAATAPVAAYPVHPIYPSDNATMVGAAPVAPPPTTPTHVAEPDEEEPRKRHTGAWIAAIIAVLLIIGAAAWGVPKLLDDDKPAVATVAVPKVAGDDQDTAKLKLENAKLVLGTVTQRPDADVDAGDVIESDPAAATSVKEGSKVNLVVSTGPQKITMPYVVGKKLKDAKTDLTRAGLNDISVTQQDSDRPKNEVLNSDPSPTSEVDPGTPVTLTVSKGQTKVPNVVNKKIKDATKILEDAGLTVKTVNDPGSDKPAGTVTDEAPGAGDKVQPGSTVVLTVSAKPVETTPTTPPPSTDSPTIPPPPETTF